MQQDRMLGLNSGRELELRVFVVPKLHGEAIVQDASMLGRVVTENRTSGFLVAHASHTMVRDGIINPTDSLVSILHYKDELPYIHMFGYMQIPEDPLIPPNDVLELMRTGVRVYQALDKTLHTFSKDSFRARGITRTLGIEKPTVDPDDFLRQAPFTYQGMIPAFFEDVVVGRSIDRIIISRDTNEHYFS